MFANMKICLRLSLGFALILSLTIIIGLTADIIGDEQAQMTAKLYVSTWLHEHISKDDKALGQFLRDKPKAA